MYLQEEEQKDLSCCFAREEQHKDYKTGYVQEWSVPEKEELRQHYTQVSPPYREQLLFSISRVEMYSCFPVWVHEEPYAWLGNSQSPLVDSSFFSCSKILNRGATYLRPRGTTHVVHIYHLCSTHTHMPYIYIHTLPIREASWCSTMQHKGRTFWLPGLYSPIYDLLTYWSQFDTTYHYTQ